MKFLKALLISISIVALSGCGGGNDEQVDSTLPAGTFGAYNADEFVVNYPVNWTIKKGNQLDDRIKDNISVAFISNFKDPFFTPVVTIEKIAVSEGTTTSSFADNIISMNESNLVNYSEIERSDIQTSVGTNVVLTKLVRFQAKEQLQDDTLEFLQTYLSDGEFGYVVTGAYDPNDEDSEASKMVQSLQSFKLK